MVNKKVSLFVMIQKGFQRVCPERGILAETKASETFYCIHSNLTFKPCISELAATNIDVSATDPYADALSYFWEALDGGQISGTGESVTFTPPESDAHACPYRVRLTVSSDVSSLSAEETIEIYVHLAGDANGEGVVNILDKVIVRNQFGQSGCACS